MSIRTSQRSTREIVLLILAVVFVAGVCLTLREWTRANPQAQIFPGSKWDADRLSRLLLGPEQIACYCFFTWACLILGRRAVEVQRQRTAFGLELLPTEEGARILPEDSRPLLRKLDVQTARRGPLILATM